MAVLSAATRKKIWAGLMRYWGSNGTACGFSKLDLYNPTANTGAIADADSWIDTHSANTSGDTTGYNGSLQAPIKTQLTSEQKGEILAAVILARRSEDVLRDWLRDVD